MKFLLLLLSGIFLGIVGIGTRAEAQNYPWCAIYDGGMGGENCGFTTFEQCIETARGLGSNCQPNTQNTSLHRVRIRRPEFKCVITDRVFVELAPAAWRY
jgi:hypothetical protein